MATCNMMRNPVFQVLRFASPKVVTPFNISLEVPQHAYVFGIFVAQLLFKFLYRLWGFPDKAVRVEEKIAFLVICVSLNCIV